MKLEGREVTYAKLRAAVFLPGGGGRVAQSLKDTLIVGEAGSKVTGMTVADGCLMITVLGKHELGVPLTEVLSLVLKPVV